jgi:putative transmembrane protein Alph_Pro_TM
MLATLLFAALNAPVVPVSVSAVAPQADAGRMEISYSFSGRDLFLHGSAPPGTRRVLVVLEGPSAGTIRLMEKGRVAFFWLGVRQYRLSGMPALYLVNVSCPICNGFALCGHPENLNASNRLLAPLDLAAGREELIAHARLSSLSGPLREGESSRVLEGFWDLQGQRGLYGVHLNGIRLNNRGAFYHVFSLPASAPDGRYQVTTSFLGDDRVLGIQTSNFFVRKKGVVDWVSQLAERRPLVYGTFTVLIAVAAGWLAGTLFGRGGH